MLQWNPKGSALVVVALLTALASFGGLLDLPQLLNFAW
jgi:hypothetical protein